jgi:tetratricopeptide (TPR) repeat protein
LGLRFRKSISLGKGVRVNFSKSGVGISAGVKGYRVGVGPRGIRKTVSIPGTGISYVEEKSFKRLAKELAKEKKGFQEVVDIPAKKEKGYGWLWGIILGLFVLIANPFIGFTITAISGYYFYKAIKNPYNKMVSEYNKGVQQLNKGNFSLAENHFLTVLNYDPDDTLTLSLLTFIYFQQGVYQKVVENHSKLTEEISQDPDLGYIIAYSYFQLGNYDQAIPLLQQINNFDHIKDQANILLGRCFLEKGLLEIAVEQFKKGPVLKRTMTPEVMEAKYWLGITYFKLGDNKKALTQLQRIYAEDVNYKDVKDYLEKIIK